MSNTSVRIELGATFDPKGFSDAKKAVTDLDRYTENVRKNQLFRSDRAQSAGLLNLTRQGSDVFSQAAMGTSPFTILIQQGPQVLDILASGAMSAGKFATAFAGIGVGVAGVMGFISAYRKMDEAIQDATRSQEEYNESVVKGFKIIQQGGIAPSMQQQAEQDIIAKINEAGVQEAALVTKQLQNAEKFYEERLFTYGKMRMQEMGMTQESVIKEQFDREDVRRQLDEIRNRRREAIKTLEDVQSKRSSEVGGARLFAEQIDPAAMKAMQDRAMQEAAKTLTLSDVARTRQSLEAVSREYDAMPPSPEKAQALNGITKTTEALNALEKAIMERVSSEQERTQEVLDTFFDGTFRSQQEEKSRTAAMTAEAASARQRIGGMANAPILSSFQKQVDLLKNIADTSRQTAANTARSTPPASPVSFPDTDFGEWQSSRLRTFN